MGLGWYLNSLLSTTEIEVESGAPEMLPMFTSERDGADPGLNTELQSLAAITGVVSSFCRMGTVMDLHNATSHLKNLAQAWPLAKSVAHAITVPSNPICEDSSAISMFGKGPLKAEQMFGQQQESNPDSLWIALGMYPNASSTVAVHAWRAFIADAKFWQAYSMDMPVREHPTSCGKISFRSLLTGSLELAAWIL